MLYVSENYSRQQSYRQRTHSVFPQVLMTDRVAEAETSATHRISTQLFQKLTLPTYLHCSGDWASASFITS